MNTFAWTISMGFFAGVSAVLSFSTLFPQALFRSGDVLELIPRSVFGSLPCNGFLRALFRRDSFLALFCKAFFVHFCTEPFSVHPFAGFVPSAFVQGLISKPSFRKLFWQAPLQGFSHGFFPQSTFHAPSRMDNSMDSFAASISELYFVGLFSRVLFCSGYIYGHFPVNFLRAFFRRDISVRSFAVVFSLRFFRFASVHFSTEPFFVRSLARFCPWVFFPRGTSFAIFRMDGFNRNFRRIVFSALSGGKFFGAFFSGASSVHIFACETSLGSFAGVFWYVFSQGFYHGLFLGDIYRELFRMDNLQGVFSVLSHARLFPRASFRNGSIHWLIPRSFFLAILCIDFLRALFWRGLLRARFLVCSPCASSQNHLAAALPLSFLRCAFEQSLYSRALYPKRFSARSFAVLSP